MRKNSVQTFSKHMLVVSVIIKKEFIDGVVVDNLFKSRKTRVSRGEEASFLKASGVGEET